MATPNKVEPKRLICTLQTNRIDVYLLQRGSYSTDAPREHQCRFSPRQGLIRPAGRPEGIAMTTSLSAVLERVDCPRVLVLGDFLLERTTWGNAERISPEAPVLVLRADRKETQVGG